VGGAVRRADALANDGLADAAGAWARRECLVSAGLSREARQAGEPDLEEPRVTTDVLEDVEVRRGTGGSEVGAAHEVLQSLKRAKMQVALQSYHALP
jgi:hypothetical protein